MIGYTCVPEVRAESTGAAFPALGSWRCQGATCSASGSLHAHQHMHSKFVSLRPLIVVFRALALQGDVGKCISACAAVRCRSGFKCVLSSVRFPLIRQGSAVFVGCFLRCARPSRYRFCGRVVPPFGKPCIHSMCSFHNDNMQRGRAKCTRRPKPVNPCKGKKCRKAFKCIAKVRVTQGSTGLLHSVSLGHLPALASTSVHAS